MELQRFVQPYPDEMTQAEIHRGPHAKYIPEAQQYSYEWGRMFQYVARGGEGESPVVPSIMGEYRQWIHEGGYGAEHDSLFEAGVETDHLARGLNGLNFHHLNARMMWLWLPFFEEGWKSDKERVDMIDEAQHKLAIDGLREYDQRQNYIKEHGGTHALFEEDYKDIHASYVGIMQEYDAAIVLLNVMRRHRNLVALPAPLQFERSRKRINVDFLMVDIVDRNAVGIQVKSRLRQSDVEGTDPERVIFLDGDLDLNNIKLVRTQKARSTESVKPWPGIIAAKKVEMMKNTRQSVHYFDNPRMMPTLKFLARHLVGELRVDHRELAGRIGERIMQKI